MPVDMSVRKRFPLYKSPSFWVGMLFSLVVILPFFFRLEPYAIDQVEIHIQAEKPDRMELYWNMGKGYRAEEVSVSAIAGGGGREIHRFVVPQGARSKVRFDPVSSDQEIRVLAIFWLRDGEQPVAIEWDNLTVLAGVADILGDGNEKIVTPLDGHQDPQLILTLDQMKQGWPVGLNIRWQPSGYVWILGGAWIGGVLLIRRWHLVFRRPSGTPLSAARNEIRGVCLVIFVMGLSWAGAWGMWRWWDGTGWGEVIDEGWILEIAMETRSQQADFSQMFFDMGEGFSERNTQIIPLFEGDGEEAQRRYRYRLPEGNVYTLRWDPINASGEIWIHGLYLRHGKQQVSLPLNRLIPNNDLAVSSWGEDRLYGITPEGGSDPSMLLREYLVLSESGDVLFGFRLRWFAGLAVTALWFLLLWVWDGPTRSLLKRQP